ncbi:hypothetical protein [Rhodococcus sp. 14-2470-1a]|nr:hypothetical protein [Rhodococcus sp. 14-2470-1a]
MKYEELKAAAAQGATIAAVAAKREREQKITDAITQGHLAPGGR